MAFLDSKHQRAAFIVLALGAALLWALGPYATGIIGIPVLAVLFSPVHEWLVRHGVPRSVSALFVTLLGAVLLLTRIILVARVLRPVAVAGSMTRPPPDMPNQITPLASSVIARTSGSAGLPEPSPCVQPWPSFRVPPTNSNPPLSLPAEATLPPRYRYVQTYLFGSLRFRRPVLCFARWPARA